MGGDAAKERRRMKRLNASSSSSSSSSDASKATFTTTTNDVGGDDGVGGGKVDVPRRRPAPPIPDGKRRERTTTDGEDVVGAPSSDAVVARYRLQRKMARKASGKFKTATATATSNAAPHDGPRSMYPSDDERRTSTTRGGGDKGGGRRTVVRSHRFDGTASSSSSYAGGGRTKEGRRGSTSSSRSPRDRNARVATSTRTSVPRRNDGGRSARKIEDDKNDRKEDDVAAGGTRTKKKNKPKHLKRKMDQLLTNIPASVGDETSRDVVVDANIVDAMSDLESRMNILAEQMRQLKRMKRERESGSRPARGGEPVENGGGADGGDALPNIDDDGVDVHRRGGGGGGGNDDDDGMYDGVQMEPPSSVKEDPVPSNDDAPSSSSSDDDEDVTAISSNARSRGNRRRGQRDGAGSRRGGVVDDDAPLRDGDGIDVASGTGVASPDRTGAANNVRPPTTIASNRPAADVVVASLIKGGSSTATKERKGRDKRRCIGRRPVTDFVIGDSYPGTVRYIKPALGAFVDVGSHSDAFCHISCTSDAFVSSVTDVLKVDDVVNVRVVEVDRTRKRITVSMRSADAAANEGVRLRTTRQYERGANDPIVDGDRNDTVLGGSGGSRDDEDRTNEDAGGACRDHESSSDRAISHSSISISANPIVDVKRERRLARRAERRIQNEGQKLGSEVHDLDEGRMQGNLVSNTGYTDKVGTDLKRERKLARRAERRAAMEAANASA